MGERFDFPEIPKPEKPELELAWRGLIISIRGSGMSREQAIQMLEDWDQKQPSAEVIELHPNIPDGAA